MQIYRLKPAFQKFLLPLEKYCVDARISPDSLNRIGIVASIVMGCILYTAARWNPLLLLVPFLALARTAANALDGLVSRRLEIAGPLGEVKNEFGDRISHVPIFLPLGLSPRVSTEYVLIAIALMLVNSYVGIVGKSAGGKRIYSGWMGKADRMAYLSAASVAAFFGGVEWIHIFLLLMIVLLVISIYQRWSEILVDIPDR